MGSSRSHPSVKQALLVSVVGDSGSGKTFWIENLIPRLRAQGFRVGVLKHAHEGFDLDKPGKDSWRYHKAGAEIVAVSSPKRAFLFFSVGKDDGLEELLQFLKRKSQIVFIEGYRAFGDWQIRIHFKRVSSTRNCAEVSLKRVNKREVYFLPEDIALLADVVLRETLRKLD